MRTLPLAQIGPAKINAALRQVAEASGYGAAKTLSAVYRNVSGLALTHEALTQNPANAATMPSKASMGAQERPERDTKRACTQAEEEALVAWVAATPEANGAQLVTLVDVLRGAGVRIAEAINLNWGCGLRGGPPGGVWHEDQVERCPTGWCRGCGIGRSQYRGRNRIARYARARKGCAGTRRTRAAPCVNSWRRRASPWARSHTFRKTVQSPPSSIRGWTDCPGDREPSRPLRHRLHHDLHGSTARLPAGRNGPLSAHKEAPEGEARV